VFTPYNQLVSFQSNAVRYVLRYQWNITKERSFLFLKSNHDEMELQGRIYLFILQDHFLPNTPWRDWLNISTLTPYPDFEPTMQSVALSPLCILTGEAANNNVIVFGLTRPWLEPYRLVNLSRAVLSLLYRVKESSVWPRG
jgi:hypothetical protein